MEKVRPNSEYFKGKLEIKYGNHPNVGQSEIDRTSKTLSSLDEKLDGLMFSFNQNYVLIEKLNPESGEPDLKICTIDFTNQRPRIFYNMNTDQFEDFDEFGRMGIFNYANFGGGATAKPFYIFEDFRLNRNEWAGYEFFVNIVIAVHDFLVRLFWR
jgi:hypothetical protein